MRFSVIAMDFMFNIKTWLRSKGTLFWTLAFPVMLIIIFGAIFSGVGDVNYTLHIQDLDDSEMSKSLIRILSETGVITIKNVSEDVDILAYIEKNDITRLIVIPEDYMDSIQSSFVDHNQTVNITFYFDQSEQQSNQIVRSIISNVIRSLNMELSNGREIIKIDEVETISGEFDFIDFFLPGMIGFTIMQSCIYGSIERNTKYRKDGILRKLLTTPITRAEWILSKMMFMLFLSFISTFLIVFVGVIIWGINVHINIVMIILIVATSFLFSGMGMLIGRFVKDEETADTAGGAISFPMMFLAGTFFPLETMPQFLQDFARVLPLYYVNEGLRNAMIYLDTSKALINTFAVLLFALIFFLAGVFLTKWKEE